MMELDFRHSELFANPIHLLAIHLYEQYGYFVKTSTEDTCLLHLKSIYVILYRWQERPVPALRYQELDESCVGCAFSAFSITLEKPNAAPGEFDVPTLQDPCFDARSKGFEVEPRPRRVSSFTTAQLQREEYRLRLKRLPPIRQGGRFPPTFKSSTGRPRPDALAPPPFCAVLETKTHFSVSERKIEPRSLFLS
jgi:hypothetical protein